ncbi:hypothetical protein [Caulobacter sp. S45]|uniref:hypothetical protein n=1 Tax=Caulobacter sp. S45 TaxID=1641861 RepID=UPI00131D03C7|nr:hypothetical protein [Caulobacter sp. S45]
MHAEPPLRAGSDIVRVARGLGRLLRFDARWVEGFDFSMRGFLQSFYGPLLAMPFYVFYIAMVQSTQASGRGLSALVLGVAAGEHLLDAFGYILIIAVISRPLRVGAGFSAFATVVNWSSLFLNAPLAVASLLLMGGQDGLEGFGLFGLLLVCLSVYVIWRAARETLTREIAPLALVVVLAVAWSTVVDQVVGWATAGL